MLAKGEVVPERGEKGRTGGLAPGEHGVTIDGVEQRYHVAGRGPVCLVHSGGPASAGSTCGCPRSSGT